VPLLVVLVVLVPVLVVLVVLVLVLVLLVYAGQPCYPMCHRTTWEDMNGLSAAERLVWNNPRLLCC
jgi:hypothetical protein